jgi:hypothetical protein
MAKVKVLIEEHFTNSFEIEVPDESVDDALCIAAKKYSDGDLKVDRTETSAVLLCEGDGDSEWMEIYRLI